MSCMSDEIAHIYESIKSLEYDDLAGCMKLYKRLNDFQLKYASFIDGRIRHIMDRIMTAKKTINIETLDYTDEKIKWDRLNPMQLNVGTRGFQPGECDILWRFLKDQDLNTEAERHALGIEMRYYDLWKEKWVGLVREKGEGIRDIDNMVAKCICTLDRCLKIFCQSETGALVRHNAHKSMIGKRKRVQFLLYQMKQLLLQ